jgi:Beta-lactamase enzyme family
LPGAVTFELVRLDDGKVLGSLNPDRPLAIGSAFKLYLLAELEERGIAWDRVVKVEDKYKSLPTGEMRNWPAGSPVTVDTIAVKMISESDNTAADHMLGLLGRENVERFLGKAGMANPAADIPFLSTGEAFALKANASMLADYLNADVAEKRVILEQIDVLGMEGLAGLNLSKPVAIDKIEWFASAADLCRVMEWFDKQNDPTVLGILAVNPGLGFSRETFEYIGYKGGSEPGVLNMTWLLRSRSGKHYAMSAGWNDPSKEVDLAKFSALMMTAADLIEDGQK